MAPAPVLQFTVTVGAGTRRQLSASHAYCERLARQQAGNFYHAFRLLPTDQRRGMCAVYSFLRVADDLTDVAGATEKKRSALESWRRQLHEALAGKYNHVLHAALHETVDRFHIPVSYLDAVLDGVAMDLDTDSYETFVGLYRYCYHVASAVGLACIHIWGVTAEQAAAPAEAAGIAFQLTNILRDLAEDAGRGRVYLPREDLARFGYSEEKLRLGIRDNGFVELMRFEVARANSYYDAALPLADLLRPVNRAVFLVMLRTYRGLLDEIVRRDYDVFSTRVRLSRLHKLWLAARVLPLRWGWT
jgi:phytoene synthase